MIRRIFQYLAALLYLSSMPLEAFTVGDASVNGIAAVIYGWVGFGKSFGWSWLANPLFILTLFFFFHRKTSARRAAVSMAAAAFLLSFSFLLVDKIPGEKTEPMVGMVTRAAGYWIWLCSMASLLVAAVLNNSEGRSKLQSAG
jgi:hypothetical protein